jgi:hypothetical protein
MGDNHDIWIDNSDDIIPVVLAVAAAGVSSHICNIVYGGGDGLKDESMRRVPQCILYFKAQGVRVRKTMRATAGRPYIGDWNNMPVFGRS